MAHLSSVPVTPAAAPGPAPGPVVRPEEVGAAVLATATQPVDLQCCQELKGDSSSETATAPAEVVTATTIEAEAEAEAGAAAGVGAGAGAGPLPSPKYGMVLNHAAAGVKPGTGT